VRAVICVPRRGQQEDYDRAWSIIAAYYATTGIEVVVADSPGERFNLPAARNAAAAMAGVWDVAAFINADCLVPEESLRRGFGHALETGRLVVPWDHYYSMTAAGHVAGYDLDCPLDSYFCAQRWRDHSETFQQPFYAPGGDIIIPRALWDMLGGWDERLSVHMPEPEDAAMLVAAAPFDRLSGPAYHFWHPTGTTAYSDSASVWPEYRKRWHAMRDRGGVVQRLVDEGREISDFGNWDW
jgi:hypothetical protein